MIDRHTVQALLQAGHSTRYIAQHVRVSRRSVQCIAQEPPVTAVDDAAARAARGSGRPGLVPALQALISGWLVEDPLVPPGDVQPLFI